MSDIKVECTNWEIVNFLACPVLHTSTNFLLTDEEKNSLMTSSFKSPTHAEWEEQGGKHGVKVSQNNTILETEGLERVKTFMVDFVKSYVKNHLKITDEFYLTNSWATLNEKGNKHHGHSHPNTLLSCVYYVSAESGELVVSNDKNNLFPNFDFKFNVEEYNNYTAKSWRFNVKTGDIVLFPGWLNHYSTPNESDTQRILIGSNYFTRGTFGQYEHTDLLEIK